MTSPFLRALAGEAVWPPPIWLMRQAGRYLPEYRAIRAKAGGMLDLCLNSELATEVTLQPIRRYGFDAAILFSDLPLLCWALGQNLRYEEGEGPLLDPITDAAQLARLDGARVAGAVSPVLEAVRRLRRELPADCALIGFAGSPWTVACYMAEGRGSKEFTAARLMAYADPALFAALTDLLVEQTAAYLGMQIEAGADVVMLFDSWAGVLPAAGFRQHVIEPTRRVVQMLRERHPAVPVIGFPRLAGALLAEYVAATGVQAVGVDTAADPARVAAAIPATVAVQGNLDPLALVVGGETQAGATQRVLQAWRGRPAIFNLGHGIVPATPPEHVATLVRTVRDA